MKKLIAFSAVLSFAAALSIVLIVSCSSKSPVSPVGIQNTDNGVLSQAVIGAMAVQNRHTPELMRMDEVMGTATGTDANGNPVLTVYTKSQAKPSGVPASFEGIPIVVEVTGEIHAMAGRAVPAAAQAAVTKVSHTAKQKPPIQLGTSGGWAYDLANGYCCGGTLGALVTNGVNQYIMSCWHVFQADIVSGGNKIVAVSGDPAVQPGLIDASCRVGNTQAVAKLSPLDFSPSGPSLPNSNVDVSIAQVVTGMVSTNGSILEIGTISKSIVAASLNQAVKKSGRTTGLTTSTVSGLNATIKVTYDNECAGGTAFTKTFTGQIIVKNTGSKFLNSGDSGSLLVENKSTNPRAIGLLYAGSSTTAVANPIGQVLSYLSSISGTTFTMVGQ